MAAVIGSAAPLKSMSTVKGGVQSEMRSDVKSSFNIYYIEWLVMMLIPQMVPLTVSPATKLRNWPQYLLWMAAEALPVGLQVAAGEREIGQFIVRTLGS